MSKEGSEEDRKKQDVIRRDIIRHLTAQGYIIDSETRKEIENLPQEKIAQLGVSVDRGYSGRELIKQFENELLPESPRLMARLTVLKAIKSMKESGIKVSESQAKKIVDKLSPALEELDLEYLQKNSNIIVTAIENDIKSKSMITSNALGGLYIRERNLDKIYSELEGFLTASDQFLSKKIDSKLFGLSDSEVSNRLNELGVENAQASKYDLSKITVPELVEMRRENKEQFDEIVLRRKQREGYFVVDPNRKPDAVVEAAVDELVKKNGVKLTRQARDALTQKVQEKLVPVLSQLEPEYLHLHHEKVAVEIQKELFKNKSILYYLGGDFSVSDKSLDNISKSIKSHHQKASDYTASNVVEMGIKALNRPTIEQGLANLAVEKAKAAKFKANEMMTPILLEKRRENPERFDKVVLKIEKGKIKEKAAASVEPRVRLTPPPRLSEIAKGGGVGR